jgi:hypothetical protein
MGVATLTPEGQRSLPCFAHDPNRSWRGWSLHVARRANTPRAPVVARLEPPVDDPLPLPAAFDVKSALLYLWGRA